MEHFFIDPLQFPVVNEEQEVLVAKIHKQIEIACFDGGYQIHIILWAMQIVRDNPDMPIIECWEQAMKAWNVPLK